MPDVGDLVRSTSGAWQTHAPTHCPHGHRLGPGQVLVGHAACLGHGGGGHIVWHCMNCPADDLPVYGPPLGPHCTVLDGPASVRISNRS